ncbi:hypothetical protein ZYGR_0N00180 [Zygosaccharomyces rouxii]|uniref:ZYRO0D00836p n=2 Tax=Zygosaccharomyces rouxii TaxID=4956 RepID=C5DUR8_ZYGRC|nr:uncharacterized protein ZYRO0D00836g [Zygosaccharomyces rouxii]KAH9200454.1 hypothetical protein LQ764DRAFT_94992 [Zygosaccharomyces rouxii]GAV48614.1 hypothetical protein ZYGR_0N00180 [Zygosaccharomyces rouxii]CAR27537.1 ZYRO0D00836p [Zygosaccharomyces rouxii]
MSNVKDLLKEAKVELSREDYVEAVKICKKVLNADKENYFAHVFMGKSYSNMDNRIQDAIDHYNKAIELLPEELLAWKGLYLVFKESDVIPSIVNFDTYFEFCGGYARALANKGVSQVDLIHDIRVFRKTHTDCEESFLRHMVPGTPTAEQLARHLISAQDAISGLIRILNSKQQDQISKHVSRERLKLSANDPSYQGKINTLSWEVYKDSELDDLYNQLINITDDDEQRSNLEAQWLEYRLKVLKSTPQNLKGSSFEKLKRMTEDMVLVDHASIRPWKLYFEWQDYENLDSMDMDLIMKFFRKFPIEPLAVILYAWVCSNFSQYDTKKLQTEAEKKSSAQDETNELNEIDESEKRALKEMMEAENDTTTMAEDEVMTALMDNITRAQSSALAHRIVSQYYIYSKENEAALTYVKKGASLVAYEVRDYGAHLVNSKREFTLKLATLYIYIDSPKNHSLALSLFEKVLKENPENTQAKMGKGLIFMERQNYTDAKLLLSEVISQYADNLEFLSELAWCEACLGNLDESIGILNKVLTSLQGTDLRTSAFRALNIWRLAKTHVLKQEKENPEDQKYVKIAFRLLIQSIKVLDTYAPNYSALGDIYNRFYKDGVRAFKCFYKAFELDDSDLMAARYMSENYTELGNWQAARVVCERLVGSERAKRALQTVNWPFRVIGIAYLEGQQEANSIEWFQSALRVNQSDVEAWVGLGQAYYACGRIEASIKVFEKAIELDSEHHYAKYLKAQSLSLMGQFDEAIDILNALTEILPQETIFQMTKATILVNYAHDLYSQGFLMKSVATAADAIGIMQFIATELSFYGQALWIGILKALKLFIWVESKVGDLPVEALISTFGAVSTSNQVLNSIDELDGITLDNILSEIEDSSISIACKLLILSAKYAVATTTYEALTRTVRSSLWYNIGTSELSAYHILKNDKFRDSAIASFKKSIQYQSNTVESWMGLGIATMDVNYRVAQHCFIKCTAMAPKEGSVWFDLALLALQNNDAEFALTVLNKSQSIAPQDSSPWLGNALILEKQGKIKESCRMFAHAFILSNGRSKAAQLYFAKSVLQNRIGYSGDERDISAVEELSAVVHGLDQYFKKSPSDSFALQCALLALERLRIFPYATGVADRLVRLIESRFEKGQDNDELYNFAVVKAQIARVQLGLGQYDAVIENADLSRSILVDFENENNTSIFVSNHICLALAYFFSDNFDETLTHLEELLRLSKESKHLVILISKLLYSVGSEDTKTIAIEELTECLSNKNGDLILCLTLAAIALLEGKREDMSIVFGRLRETPLEDVIADEHRDLPYLMDLLYKKLSHGKSTGNGVSWQRSAFFFMNDNKVWTDLSKKIQQRVASDGQNKVTSRQLSDCYWSQKNLKSIQRSIFLCPDNASAVSALNQCF